MKKIIIAAAALLVLLTTFALAPQHAKAQELSVDPSATITSRFIYRGLDLGSSPQIQPSVAFNYDNFNFTLWGSHPLSLTPDGTEYKEVKFWMNYTFDLGNMTLTPQFENHFDANTDVFDLDEETTTHVWQASVRAAAKGDVAPDLLVGYAFSGIQGFEPTLYVEPGVAFSAGDTGLRAFLSSQYSEEGGFIDLGYEGDFVFTQVGLSASKDLRISDSFTVPMSVMVVINPETERAFTAFSVNF
ncbi:MAG: hypothetical protein ACOC2C_02590 [Cyclonatronaceae bacterium]